MKKRIMIDDSNKHFNRWEHEKGFIESFGKKIDPNDLDTYSWDYGFGAKSRVCKDNNESGDK